MLVAKGYGNANPVAGNDTLEGRMRNRRIEYRLVKPA
jgi:OOP family OmpA-OmpF porin